MKPFNSITELIFNTPIVRLPKISAEIGGGTLHVKLESQNPGGSVKDRIGLSMIEAAERAGVLKKGMTIIEPTSGNTGIGLALVAAAKGYPLILTMPETMTVERRRLLAAYGAKLVLTPGPKGMPGAIARAHELMEEIPNAFMPQQFANPANPEIHRKTTAQEIWDAFGENLHCFVAGVGTGGTVTGVGEVLKPKIPHLRMVAIEPLDSPVLSGGSPGPHKIQGIGAGFKPDILNMDVIDKIAKVTWEHALEGARRLALGEGILGGISSGAIAQIAFDEAAKLKPDQNVVFILCDTGERYLSTELFPEPEMYGE
ncbi:MAG: cysteine synthase A [Planctomycetota bacterium]|jgi:cysteine synthase A